MGSARIARIQWKTKPDGAALRTGWMDFGLPDHIPMVRDTLRRFVREEMPRAKAAKWDKDNHFPRDVLNKLAELGLMGLTVSEEYGGLGRDILGTMITIEELSKRS